MKTIWYMGVKTRLIPGFIEDALASSAPEGSTMLDLCSGSAAVTAALAPRFRVVANDVQAYAAAIARAYVVHDEREKAAFLASLDPVRDLGVELARNQAALAAALAPALALEDAFLEAHGLRPAAGAGPLAEAPVDPRARGEALDAASYRRFALERTPRFEETREARFEGTFREARRLLARDAVLARRDDPARGPAILATAYYPNVYLGIRQAIATDSLRWAIDRIDPRDPFARSKRAHYLAALLHALSVSTSATSHFCQPRGLTSAAEVEAVLARRSVSIAARTVDFAREIASVVATTPVRAGNDAVAGEWRRLFSGADGGWSGPGKAPAVVYADPPYTADNYSRFYHLLEVVTDYDYPPLDVARGAATKGRYPSRERRHQSAFCKRGTVEREVRDLFAACARAGAACVFSYALESGLLMKRWREDEGLSASGALARLRDVAGTSYASVEVREHRLAHSGQGDSNHTVTELLLVCRKPRAVARRAAFAPAAGRVVG